MTQTLMSNFRLWINKGFSIYFYIIKVLNFTFDLKLLKFSVVSSSSFATGDIYVEATSGSDFRCDFLKFSTSFP
jgi:hypothetical protein